MPCATCRNERDADSTWREKNLNGDALFRERSWSFNLFDNVHQVSDLREGRNAGVGIDVRLFIAWKKNALTAVHEVFNVFLSNGGGLYFEVGGGGKIIVETMVSEPFWAV